ncbi:hypothetical protein ACPCTG_31540 [Streptomyces pseudogriseolus]|uniref:hypothetical protein n=1 Tax=Streptomyces pseudogriseolus TaxID=36817 RepID=UPI003FA2EB1F
MSAHGQPADGDGDVSRALAEFAETIEMGFNDIQQTLTDPATAAAYGRTLDVVERALQGSHANGMLTDEQLGELTGVIDGMRKAPGLL